MAEQSGGVLFRRMYEDMAMDRLTPEQFDKLTAELLNDMVEKIVGYAPDKSSRHRQQKMEIYYKAEGIIYFAGDICVVEDVRDKWRKSRQTA